MLAGISATKTLMFVYIYSAVFAGFAGIISAAKVGAAVGNSLGLLSELDAIAAVAVGGTSMSGGRAKVFGTVVGALIMLPWLREHIHGKISYRMGSGPMIWIP